MYDLFGRWMVGPPKSKESKNCTTTIYLFYSDLEVIKTPASPWWSGAWCTCWLYKDLRDFAANAHFPLTWACKKRNKYLQFLATKPGCAACGLTIRDPTPLFLCSLLLNHSWCCLHREVWTSTKTDCSVSLRKELNFPCLELNSLSYF